ncbi:MAG: hypothetical protein AAFO94_01530, partial [Bacteroidota bacterium]
MTVDGLHNIVPEKQQQLLLQGRDMEIAQPLFDLGYWLPGKDLDKSVDEFRQDYQLWKLVQQDEAWPELISLSGSMD